MRRYDLLDEHTTAIAPALGPQALMAARPGRRDEEGPRPHDRVEGRAIPRAAPVLLVALVCILLAFV